MRRFQRNCAGVCRIAVVRPVRWWLEIVGCLVFVIQVYYCVIVSGCGVYTVCVRCNTRITALFLQHVVYLGLASSLMVKETCSFWICQPTG